MKVLVHFYILFQKSFIRFFFLQDLQDMMEEADQNGDGFIDKEEFIKIMLQTNLFWSFVKYDW